MTNYKLLLLIGFITLFVPFLGVPEIIREWLVAISSLVLITYAFFARSYVKKENFDENNSVYVDSEKKDINQEVTEEVVRVEPIEEISNEFVDSSDEGSYVELKEDDFVNKEK